MSSYFSFFSSLSSAKVSIMIPIKILSEIVVIIAKNDRS
jgi:hypothetical protein